MASKPIRPLPPEVIAQIKSSIIITKLSDVVIGLVRNSLDASATRISIIVDFARGGCEVEDDGEGIISEEFGDGGGLGLPYNTSRLHDQQSYGRHGNFLAALSAISLLTIASRQTSQQSLNALVLHQASVVARMTPAPADYELTANGSGTRIIIRNLFCNMPVRVKQRAAEVAMADEREWRSLTISVVALLLAWHMPLAISLKGKSTTCKLNIRHTETKTGASKELRPSSFDLKHMLSILTQSGIIAANCWPAWIPVTASSSSFRIRGAISLDPMPTKEVQYISIGPEPISNELGHNELFDAINRIFASSNFGCQYNELDKEDLAKRRQDARFKQDGFTNQQLKGARKGIDKWPMFYLRLETKDGIDTVGIAKHYASGISHENRFPAVIDLVGAVVTEWLRQNHFQPRMWEPRKTATTTEDSEPKRNIRTALPERSTKRAADIVAVTESRSSSPILSSRNSNKAKSNNLENQVPADRKVGRKLDDMKGISPGISAFATWSKIKSSNQKFYVKAIRPAKPSLSSAVEGRNLLGENPPRPQSTAGECTKPTSQEEEHLDLLEVPATWIQSHDASDPIAHSRASPEPALASVAEDGYTTWKDPITGEQYLLNLRSGTSHRAGMDTKLSKSQPHLSLGRARLSLPGGAGGSSKKTSNPGQPTNTFLEGWNNPVFSTSVKDIPSVSYQPPHADGCGMKYRTGCMENSNGRDHEANRLSVAGLRQARNVAQVDMKFILVKVPHAHPSPDAEASCRPSLVLALIDQHAADERIKVEALFHELCVGVAPSPSAVKSNLGHQAFVASAQLAKPIFFQVPAREADLFKAHAAFYAQWGIVYDLILISTAVSGGSYDAVGETDHRVVVRTLPLAISERCEADPKLIINILRAECWKRHESGAHQRATSAADDLSEDDKDRKVWLRRLTHCPTGIVDLINSRACRGAIMFNDVLSLDECAKLIARLADCAFPFQCAHGRPSMVPLVDLGQEDGAVGFTGGADTAVPDYGFGGSFIVISMTSIASLRGREAGFRTGMYGASSHMITLLAIPFLITVTTCIPPPADFRGPSLNIAKSVTVPLIRKTILTSNNDIHGGGLPAITDNRAELPWLKDTRVARDVQPNPGGGAHTVVVPEVNAESFWFAEFNVGRSETLSLLIDTGSSDIYLNPGTTYVPGFVTSKNLGRDFKITFATTNSDGTGTETLTGELWTDNVGLPGGLHVADQMLGNTINPLTKSFPHDGLIGFAGQPISSFDGTPWFQNLCDRGLVASCRFGLAFNANGTGRQTLGDVDAAYEEELSVAPLMKGGQWATWMDVVVAGQIVTADQLVVLDSGTSVIYGPINAVERIYERLGIESKRFRGSISEGKPTYLNGYFPCDFPPSGLGLAFPSASNASTASASNTAGTGYNSSRTFELAPSVWVAPGEDATGSNCKGVLQGTDAFGDQWVVGQAFFQGRYIDHNVDDQTMGFANLFADETSQGTQGRELGTVGIGDNGT